MRRRKLLKRIAATGAAVTGASGIGAASTDGLRGNYIRTTIDGEARTLSHEEFDAHPETPALDDVNQQDACYFECCECCSPVPEDCTDGLCDCVRECGSCY